MTRTVNRPMKMNGWRRLRSARSLSEQFGPVKGVGAEKCVLRLDGQPVGLRWVA